MTKAKTPAKQRFSATHENAHYVKSGVPHRLGPMRVPGLRLQLVDTDEGVEFHVLGRGEPLVTYSVTTAERELMQRLDLHEQLEVFNRGLTVREVVAVAQWDRMSGWCGDDVCDAEPLVELSVEPTVIAGGKPARNYDDAAAVEAAVA